MTFRGRSFHLVFLLFIVISIIESVAAAPVRYDDHLVVRATIRDEHDLTFLQRISPDMWSHRVEVGGVADFRVPPDQRAALDASGVPHAILIDNLQALIDAERPVGTEDAWRPGMLDGSFFDQYRRYPEVLAFLDDLATLRPDLASVVEVGESLEGRMVKAIRITGPNQTAARPGVLLNGCQHAREWITVMANCYIADRFVREYDIDPQIQAILDTHELYIIPVVNPDGYEFSWDRDRMWRKNRRGGYGVDTNRNWSVGWGGPGAGTQTQMQTYRGEYAFSEPETANIRDFVSDRPNLVAHVDIHCYSQLVLYPWGWTRDHCADHDIFDAVSGDIAGAMRDVEGRPFRYGPVFTTIYPASGVMSDWTYGDRNMFGITFELRDTGQFGFVLPPEQIIPGSEEALAGALALFEADYDFGMVFDTTPLVRGEAGEFRAGRAIAGAEVYFVYSFAGAGETPVPSLGVTLGIMTPRVAGSSVADADGVATLPVSVPPGGPIRVVWLQAAHLNRISQVRVEQIN
ncbi:MAG: M14 family metallopeptidase [Phycisphaerales bacterium]